MNAQRYLRSFVPVVLAVFALVAVSYGQAAQSSLAGQTIKWDDYIFKFSPSGLTALALNNSGKLVGSILVMNGEMQVHPLTGPDIDKLKKSFEDWKTYNARLGSGSNPASPASAAEGPGAGDQVTWNNNDPIVRLSDGWLVAFSGGKGKKATVTSPAGLVTTMEYTEPAKNPVDAVKGTAAAIFGGFTTGMKTQRLVGGWTGEVQGHRGKRFSQGNNITAAAQLVPTPIRQAASAMLRAEQVVAAQDGQHHPYTFVGTSDLKIVESGRT